MRSVTVFGIMFAYEFVLRLVYYGVAFSLAQHLVYPLGLRHSGVNALINLFYGFSAVTSLFWAICADVNKDGLFYVLKIGSVVYAISLAFLCLATYAEFSPVAKDIIINRDWIASVNRSPAVILYIGVLIFGASYSAIKTTTSPIIGNLHNLIVLYKQNASFEDDALSSSEWKIGRLYARFQRMILRANIEIDQVYRAYYWIINAGAFVGILLIPHFTDEIGVHFTSTKAAGNFTWCQTPLTDAKGSATSAHANYILSFAEPYLLCTVLSLFCVSLALLGDRARKYIAKTTLIRDSSIKIHVKDESLHESGDFSVLKKKSPTFKDFKELLLAPEVLKIFGILPLFWLVSNQQSSNFILQAHFLRKPKWMSSPSILNAINSIILLTVIPVMEVLLYSAKGLKKWFTPKRRVLLGLFFSALSMLYASCLQCAILTRGSFDEHHNYTAKAEMLSIYFQVPVYLLQTLAEIFTAITIFELAYTLSPPEMKAFGSALYMMSSFVASLLGMLVTPITSPERIIYLFGACTILVAVQLVLFKIHFPETIR